MIYLLVSKLFIHLALVWIIGLKRHGLDRDGLLVMVRRYLFRSYSMTMVAEAMFGCSGSIADLPCGPILLKETLDYACNTAEQQIFSSLQIFARHFKDLPPPFCIPKELSDQYRHIVADLELGETPPTSSSFLLLNPFVGDHHLKVLSLWKYLGALAHVWRQCWRLGLL